MMENFVKKNKGHASHSQKIYQDLDVMLIQVQTELKIIKKKRKKEGMG